MSKPRPRRSNAPPRMPSTPPPPPVSAPEPETPPPPPLGQDDIETRRIQFTPYVDPLPDAPRAAPAVPIADEPEPSLPDAPVVDAEDTAPDLAKRAARDAAQVPFEEPGFGEPPTTTPRARLGTYAKLALALFGASVVFAGFRVLYAGGPRGVDIARAASSVPEIGSNTEPAPRLPSADTVAAPVLDFDAALAEEPEGAKRDALLALEARRLPEAIAAGERAVALDPTDGEAWLIVGAAYQEFGQLGEARRCYRACVTKGKHDPRGECAAMLR